MIEQLTAASDLEDLIEVSSTRDVWLFKHSLICGVSTSALREFERFAERLGGAARYVVLEIQKHRDASAHVASLTGVAHQSPQAMLLRSGSVAWHASHWDITTEALAVAAGAEDRSSRAQ